MNESADNIRSLYKIAILMSVLTITYLIVSWPVDDRDQAFATLFPFHIGASVGVAVLIVLESVMLAKLTSLTVFGHGLVLIVIFTLITAVIAVKMFLLPQSNETTPTPTVSGTGSGKNSYKPLWTTLGDSKTVTIVMYIILAFCGLSMLASLLIAAGGVPLHYQPLNRLRYGVITTDRVTPFNVPGFSQRSMLFHDLEKDDPVVLTGFGGIGEENPDVWIGHVCDRQGTIIGGEMGIPAQSVFSPEDILKTLPERYELASDKNCIVAKQKNFESLK